jgi:hypothetical protein
VLAASYEVPDAGHHSVPFMVTIWDPNVFTVLPPQDSVHDN